LVHRLRGKRSNRGGDAARREQVIERVRERYADFGPTLAAEYLAKDGFVVSVETLRRWLTKAGVWQVRRRRVEARKWRAPKEHVGEMVQMDGSPHDWFEGRREPATMMVLIDDATQRTEARLFAEETTAAAFEMFARHARRHGRPRAVYVDRASIYVTTRDATVDESLAEQPPLTQFGRAMQELDVRLICANSPQAKGRVERRHQVFQDRLVKALRLAGISDLDGANRYLEETFLPELNERFTREPASPVDFHRPVPRGVSLDVVLSFQEERVVQNDWTLSWRNRRFQLTPPDQRRSLVGRRVLVCEQLDGTLRLRDRGRDLPWTELPAMPPRASGPPPPMASRESDSMPPASPSLPRPPRRPTVGAAASKTRATTSPRVPRKPASNHPWRRGLTPRVPTAPAVP
jgi:transposase-like protein